MFEKTHPIFNFLNTHGTTMQLCLFLLLFLIGWRVEVYFAQKDAKSKWKHAFLNAQFFIVDFLPQMLLGLLFIEVMQWTGTYHFGLIYLLPSNTNLFILFLVAFVFLDLGQYIYHVVMHKAGRLWRFHAIHHSDNNVDVSTVFREHPMESVFRMCFSLFWIALSGAVFWMFIIHMLLQTFFVIFTHTNMRLSINVNRIVSLIFITPNLHQVHHHYKQPFTDTNYGDILSIWDRMFGAFCTLSADKVVFGLDTFMEENQASHLPYLLKSPFKKEKTVHLENQKNLNLSCLDFVETSLGKILK